MQQNTLTLKIARPACLEAGALFCEAGFSRAASLCDFLWLRSVNP